MGHALEHAFSPLQAFQPRGRHRHAAVVHWPAQIKTPGEWELCNLKTDRTELHNLAAQESARAQELAAKWDAWAKRANVLPSPFDKAKGRAKNTETKL